MKNLFLALFFLKITAIFAQNLPELQSGVIHWDSLQAKIENGKERQLLVDASGTSHLKVFRIHATSLPPHTISGTPHANKDADELIIVKLGKIKVTIGAKNKVVETGGVAIILADELHSLENTREVPAIYYVFRFQSKQPTDLERGKNAGGSLLLNQSETIFKSHDKGGRRDYYNRATTQCSIFEMHTTSLNAGLESHQPHIHITEEALLITKGTVTMSIDCKLYQAKAGDLVLLTSNIPHALINTTGGPCEYFAFTWR